MSQTEIGRRRKKPGSARSANCPGAVNAEVSPERRSRKVFRAISLFSITVNSVCLI